MLLGGASAVLLMAALAAWLLRPRLHAAEPALGANPVVAPFAPSTTASTTATPEEPIVAPADPPPSAAPHAAPPPQPTKPFDPRAARAALDALSPMLIDCKIASGRSGRIRVAFARDGSVSSAETLPPFAGTPKGTCVAAHLGEAKVLPFSGSAPAYTYGFMIPRY